LRKIGILTFHNVPNYGAALQAFALKKYLSKITDRDICILDFRCRGNSEEYVPENYIEKICGSKNPIKSTVKKTLFSLFSKKSYYEKHEKFENFKKNHLNITAYDEVYKDFDYVFCGSDQIWNYDITDGFQLPYFGADRSVPAETKVISYAASCGDIAEFPQEKKTELFSLVKNLDKIGVREDGLNEELNRNDIASVKTVDPTFLLSAQEYILSFGIDEKPAAEYLLEYALRPSAELDELSKKIASDKGLKLVKICGYCKMKNEQGIFNAGPEEFISMIANSSYVTTNSFHGTAFSLIFRKAFNVVLPSARKGRIFDLLNKLNLQGRISADYELADTTEIDYGKIEPLLNGEIEKSKQFINF